MSNNKTLLIIFIILFILMLSGLIMWNLEYDKCRKYKYKYELWKMIADAYIKEYEEMMEMMDEFKEKSDE